MPASSVDGLPGDLWCGACGHQWAEHFRARCLDTISRIFCICGCVGQQLPMSAGGEVET